jgi:DNA-binding HxlR family transcriptional regulator/putative sterol carrier protein
VRELVPGPRRFTDLLDGLPGISRNLLTERLRALEREGVVARKALPPPAARLVYELTAAGRELADAIVPLIRWGTGRLADREPGESFRPRWSAVGMAGLADREAAKGVNETYEYLVGDSAFHFTVDDGSVEVHDGRAHDSAVVVTTDEETYADIAAGRITASSAISAGTLAFSGDAQAVKRLRKIFSRRRMVSGRRAGRG